MLEPVSITVSEPVQAILEGYREQCDAEINRLNDDQNPLVGLATRKFEHVLRLLCALSDTTVTANLARAVIDLVEHASGQLVSEAKRAFTYSKELMLMQDVCLFCLQQKAASKRVTKARLLERFSSVSPRELNHVTEACLDAGYLVRSKGEPRGGGRGRPSVVYAPTNEAFELVVSRGGV